MMDARMARYYIETYGCTSNHGETQAIERRLRDAGHRKTDLETADVAILNTCTGCGGAPRHCPRRPPT